LTHEQYMAEPDDLVDWMISFDTIEEEMRMRALGG